MSFLGSIGNIDWNRWGPVAGGVLGGLGGLMGARNQNRAAEAAAQPQTTTQTSTRSPWGPSLPYLEEALGLARGHYIEGLDRPPAPSFGGGRALSSNTQSLLNMLTDRASDSSFVDGAQNLLLSSASAPNALMNQAFERAGGGGQSAADLQRFVDQGFGGGHDSSGGLLQMLISDLGVGQGQGSNGGGVGEPVGANPRVVRTANGGIGVVGGQQGISGTGYTHGGGVSGGGGLFNQEIHNILEGNYLDEGNPHIQGMLDRVRQEAEETYADERARLDSAASGVGRLGSSFYGSHAADLYDAHQDAVAGQQNGILFENYEAERGRMMEALGLLNNREIADGQLAAQRASANASAYASQQQMELARQGLALDAINSLSANDRANAGMLLGAIGQGLGHDEYGMGLQAQMASSFGNHQLNALGLVPALEQAGYTGLNTALGANLQADQLRGQHAQAAHNNAWRHYTESQQAPWRNFGLYMDALLGLSNAGGTTSGEATAPGQYVPTVSPWGNVLSGAFAGYTGAQSLLGSP